MRTSSEWDTAEDETGLEFRERFRARVGQGRYDELLDEPLQSILRAGAAVRGLEEELGAIRFALAKLLAEEQDAGKLAAGVARLTSAAVQATRLGQSIAQDDDASLADQLNQIFIDLEKESRVARAARKERGDERPWWQDPELADS